MIDMLAVEVRPRVLAVAVLLLLSGCAGLDDPYQRAGTWSPTGVNDANIAAMVSNPNHLIVGVDDPVSPAQLSEAAVNRLLTNKVKRLPSTQVTTLSGGAGAEGGGGGGGGGGTGAAGAGTEQ